MNKRRIYSQNSKSCHTSLTIDMNVFWTWETPNKGVFTIKKPIVNKRSNTIIRVSCSSSYRVSSSSSSRTVAVMDSIALWAAAAIVLFLQIVDSPYPYGSVITSRSQHMRVRWVPGHAVDRSGMTRKSLDQFPWSPVPNIHLPNKRHSKFQISISRWNYRTAYSTTRAIQCKFGLVLE